ncbi:hypothetical protein AB0M42_22655 [Streptomyces sp. NPDC051784]|uniref:hypothetical protein n=1 Tax=Streptomyces sp. NPDC051784 TaxID=3155805 RepID=UPI0034305326
MVARFTASSATAVTLDALIRRLTVTVPRDAVAHIHSDLADAALRMMERDMGARITSADDVTFWPWPWP